MGRIYANAERDLIGLLENNSLAGGLCWLATDIPIDMLCQNEQWHSIGDILPQESMSQVRVILTASTKRLFHDYFTSMSRKADSHRTWNAFGMTVVRSSLWTRAWTRQEIILWSKAHFIANFEFLHWELPFSISCTIIPELVECNKRSCFDQLRWALKMEYYAHEAAFEEPYSHSMRTHGSNQPSNRRREGHSSLG
jgi:hypothetical protein